MYKRNTINPHWSLSNGHEWTLNVDASVKPSSHKAGYGGILRKAYGGWMRGFIGKSSHGDATPVEAEAISKGLTWASRNGIIDIEIQSDAERVINWVLGDFELRDPICEHVENIRKWLKESWKTLARRNSETKSSMKKIKKSEKNNFIALLCLSLLYMNTIIYRVQM
ncbi:PREDICTED: uncharacterized protein LOC109177561 [Ipomoea nil]|uniref:uncharacterized protein LOC109177561 n=1 Tax=Ipomoea nil TaxID=35883 RepID=UPI0009015C13|nr:PREDICTED: uncharacterized protein LOC109177561 [Ipomoea nil]